MFLYATSISFKHELWPKQRSTKILQSLERQMRYIPPSENDVLRCTPHLHAFRCSTCAREVNYCHSVLSFSVLKFIKLRSYSLKRNNNTKKKSALGSVWIVMWNNNVGSQCNQQRTSEEEQERCQWSKYWVNETLYTGFIT